MCIYLVTQSVYIQFIYDKHTCECVYNARKCECTYHISLHIYLVTQTRGPNITATSEFTSDTRVARRSGMFRALEGSGGLTQSS